MKSSFSIEEALRFGWAKTRTHSGLLFQVLLTLFAVQVAGSIIDKVLHNTIEGVFAMLAITLVSIVVGAGFVVILLKIARGEHAVYRDIVPPARTVWNYFVVSVSSGFLVILGLILLIVPGEYLFLRYSMTRFAVIDGAGIQESFRISARITEGIKWRLLGLIVVFVLINIVGALLLLIGLLITIPVTMIGFAHVYQKLSARVESVA